MDDERFFCPDCSAEHREPLEATLGHIARCLTCALALDAGNDPAREREPLVLEIHIAA
jgi:hypothetical protein